MDTISLKRHPPTTEIHTWETPTRDTGGQVGKDGDRILSNFHLQSIVSDFAIGFFTASNLLINRPRHDDVFSDFMVLAVWGSETLIQSDLFVGRHILFR